MIEGLIFGSCYLISNFKGKTSNNYINRKKYYIQLKWNLLHFES